MLGAAALATTTVTVSGMQDDPASAAADPVVAVAGDIACPTNHAAYNGGEGTATQCRQKHTSEMILGADHVFMLGDGQYPNGSLAHYRAAYDATWGRKKSVTFPTPGDHEYRTAGAAGYFSYFGVQPYYSFDIGTWHWISLNSEIDHSATSVQTQWLRDDLAATTQPCIGAFWATPTFSSGRSGNHPSFRPFWDALYAERADLVLAGDDHDYERFAKQAPDGTAASDGIRQFVVGTGGRSLYGFGTIKPNSQARAKVFGVLDLRLGAADYGWTFRTESGGTFSDSGNAACNSSTAPPTETVSPTPTPPPSASCLATDATIVGTGGADTITGTSGADVIASLGGNDVVDGAGGDDLICTAAGADQVDAGAGNDRVDGGGGADTVTDLSGGDVMQGGAGNDTVNVGDGAAGDTASGGADTDTCHTDPGDTVRGCESTR